MVDSLDKCLRLFEQFDLSDFRESRLATYALEDYYVTVLAEIGGEYMEFDENLLEKNIGPQWNTAHRRLKSAGVIRDIPDDYNDIINRLKDTRDSVAHRFDHRPNEKRLTDAYEIAEDWREWFTANAREYQKVETDTPSDQEVAEWTRDALNEALVDPIQYDYPDLQARQQEVNEEVTENLKYIPHLHVSDQFTVELKITDSESGYSDRTLDRDGPWLVSWSDYEWAMRFKNEAEGLFDTNVSRAEEEMALKMQPNGMRCTILDFYEKPTEMVQLAVIEEEGKEDYLWCELESLSNEDRLKLEDKQVDQAMEAILGFREAGEWYIRHVIN